MRRGSPEINAGSMADIAFLLLIFFLVTTTMDVDSGITRRLPPPVDTPDDVRIKERNVLNVLINKNNKLLVNGLPGDIRNLKDVAKEFMTPHFPDNPSFPEVEEVTIPLIGTIYNSKGVISLKNDRGTSYDMYIQVQNELARAFNEIKDELSVSRFGTKFENLPADKKEAINDAVPVRVSEAEPENIGEN